MKYKMSKQENVKKTINEMFEQRGYKNIKNIEDIQIIGVGEDDKKICAYIKILEKLNVAEIHNYIAMLQTSGINHGIIVYDGIPTPAVKTVVSTIPDLDIIIELFSSEDLQFNITKHVLVPQHIKLSKDEAKDFKTKFGTDIPILLRSDPISKFYNYCKGDIIKVIRKNGFISYRIVR
jgi:DNA-directed RNA polymerase I, II, and III subunit RPABC1